jgi:hypothetical protein
MNVDDVSLEMILVDAICYLPVKNPVVRVRLTKLGWLIFDGNQHNESWKWNRELLTTLQKLDLLRLYAEMKEG